MTQVKLTKNELRVQQVKHQQLIRYLPTLQLKKAMLQQEVNIVQQQIDEEKQILDSLVNDAFSLGKILQKESMNRFYESLCVKKLHIEIENIAGIDVPVFLDVDFAPVAYHGANVPLWWDFALEQLKKLIKEKEKVLILQKKKLLLEKELREVSIRVNLFEKVLIPRTVANIKKIKIFLGDMLLSAVSQAKVAKSKIESKRKDLEGVE